jgi:anthranilate synthase/aminodeoxychorismate synthase-like glutamine amidotransferase
LFLIALIFYDSEPAFYLTLGKMILLIDNYDSFTHNLFQALAMQQADVKIVRNDQITIDQIQAMKVKGIVLSPGPGRPEDAGICVDVIQQLGGEVPILGVCLGHQAIGLAFGGKIIGAREIVHGKESRVLHQNTTLFKGVSQPFIAGRYHSLVVDHHKFPEELQVDAVDETGHIMALSHRALPIFGIQFHPESIMTVEGHKILKNFIEIQMVP